jgi:hypothetical protein
MNFEQGISNVEVKKSALNAQDGFDAGWRLPCILKLRHSLLDIRYFPTYLRVCIACINARRDGSATR